MPRPTTKSDLIDAANSQFLKLSSLLESMSEEEQNAVFLFEDRDKNLRDILVHLHEWHQLLLNWVNANQTENSKPFLPAPYNWKTYPQMNMELWEKHQNTPYAQSKAMLRESHDTVVNMIEVFSNEELFVRKHFSWTGTTTLGSYCASATSSHYDWAIKKIRKHLKTCRETPKR